MITPTVLTIAGSDSGGGAGIQADLKTFNALNVHGTTAVTCITAQNPDGVTGIQAVDPDMIEQQIAAVCDGFSVATAKTGMLFSAPIISAVAKSLRTFSIPILVVDPVMVATSGSRLLQTDAVQALCDELAPLARIITPNIPEAEILCGHRIGSLIEQESAAAEIFRKIGVACVVKGGHSTDEIVDVLYVDGETIRITGERIPALESHGTGCTYSAAIAAYLALGLDVASSVRQARQFVAAALKNAVTTGKHHPLWIKK